MFRRLVVIAAASTAALVVGATPVGAQDYPPPNNFLTIDDTTPTPGQAVTIGSGTYVEGAPVTVTLESAPVSLGAPNAGSDGTISLDTAIPADTTLGEHTITATGESPSGPLTQSITASTPSGYRSRIVADVSPV